MNFEALFTRIDSHERRQDGQPRLMQFSYGEDAHWIYDSKSEVRVFSRMEAVQAHYARLQMSGESMWDDSLIAQEAVCLFYRDREELDKGDYALIKSLERSYRGKGKWPQLRVVYPYCVPWTLKEEHIDLLCAALEAMQNGAAQEVDARTIVPMPLPLKPAKLTNEMVAARFKRLPASDDVWDVTVQAFPFPTQSDEENGAPTCPMMGMVVEENADEVVCLTIETASKPNCADVLAQEILVEGVKRGNKPCLVRFASEKAEMALGGVFEALGIRTELQPELPQLQEAFLSLMQFSAGEEE